MLQLSLFFQIIYLLLSADQSTSCQGQNSIHLVFSVPTKISVNGRVGHPDCQLAHTTAAVMVAAAATATAAHLATAFY
jgi:hypothetical protein